MSAVKTLKDLVETLEDGRKGFADGADKLADDGHNELARTFRELSQQRATFSQELRDIARGAGEMIDEDGSLGGSMHRGWMSLRDAISGNNPKGVLAAAESGEEHAVKEYSDALDADDELFKGRPVVQRQMEEIRSAQLKVQALHKAFES